MRYDIEHFWQVPDADDYAPAMERAQQWIPPDGHIELVFGPKLYRFSKKVDLYRGVSLIGLESVVGIKGDATPQGGNEAVPTLHFDNSTIGFEIHFPGTYAPEPESRGTVTMRNLVLHGSGHLSGLENHGIRVRNRPVLDGITVRQFGGDGIHAYCTSPVLPGGDENPGNCNLMKLNNVRLYLNGGHGLYLNGADSNGGVFIGLDVNANGQALLEAIQIYDSSFLGNVYIGFHIGGNQYGGRAVVTDNANARCLLLGCYVEGVKGLHMVPPSMSVGGFCGPEEGATAHIDADLNGLVRVEPGVTCMNSAGDNVIETRLGSAKIGNVALELLVDQSATQRIHYARKNPGWWEFIDSNAATLIAFAISTKFAEEGRGQIWFPNGLYFGGINSPRGKQTTELRGGIEVVVTELGGAARAEGHATAPPHAGDWAQGDKVWNSEPAAGATLGWICTVSGTPGTWASMAAIGDEEP